MVAAITGVSFERASVAWDEAGGSIKIAVLMLDGLTPAEAEGRLAVSFSWSDDAIRVTGTLQAPVRAAHSHVSGGLSQKILDALVDEHGSDIAAPDPCMWFVMRRRGVR